MSRRRADGAFGLSDDLRSLQEQLRASRGQRIACVQIAPKFHFAAASWTVHSGNAQKATLAYNIFGHRCQVRKVTTKATPTGLNGVESIALCVSTSLSFFYDLAAGLLYVNLGGVDPETVDVAAHLVLMVGNRRFNYPHMSADKLAGIGDFEVWAAGSPSGWTKTENAGGAVSQDTTLFFKGLSSAKFVATASTQALPAYVSVTGTASVAGETYLVDGFYRTAPGNPANIKANLAIFLSTTYLLEDGRETTTSPVGMDLSDTGGRWRYFRFVWRAIAGATQSVRVGISNPTGASASGSVWFDDVRFRLISSFEEVQPRLVGDVTSESGKNDVWWGGATVSVGNLELANGDQAFEVPFADLDWTGADVFVDLVGGLGDETKVASNIYRWSQGMVTGEECDDQSLRLQLSDQREYMYGQPVTLDTYRVGVYADLDLRAEGRVRPFWFGAEANITPTRYGKTSDGYGKYELADTTKAPNGIVAISTVYSYLNEDAAKQLDISRAVELVAAGSHITNDLANGRFDLATCAKILPFDELNRAFPFNVGGSTLYALPFATVGPGIRPKPVVKTLKQFATALAAAMNAAASEAADPPTTDITVAWNDSGANQYRLVVAKGAGTLNLKTTDQKPGNGWGSVGFDNAADYGSQFVVGVGARAKVASGNMTPGEPSGVIPDDILICIVEQKDNVAATMSGDWTSIYGVINGVAERAAAFWARRGATPPSFLVTRAAGDAGVAYVIAVRGCVTSGSPLNVAAGTSTSLGASATVTAPTITTVTNGCMILLIGNVGDDGTAGVFSGAEPPVEIVDDNTTLGLDCGSFADAFVQTTAGATTARTATYSVSKENAGATIALTPQLNSYRSQPLYSATNDLDGPILRVAGTGYKDDGSGTYTGSANATIEKGPDMLRLILAMMNRPRPDIDEVTFVAARTGALTLAAYINAPTTVQAVLDKLELSDEADILISPLPKGPGTAISYQIYAEGAVADEVAIVDTDFLSLPVAIKNGIDVYSRVSVLYAQDPTTGDYREVALTNDAPSVRYARDEPREFPTFIAAKTDADTRCASLAARAAVERPRFKIHIRIKLLLARLGGKATLTRARAAAAGGALTGQRFRINSITQSPLEGASMAIVVKDTP